MKKLFKELEGQTILKVEYWDGSRTCIIVTTDKGMYEFYSAQGSIHVEHSDI